MGTDLLSLSELGRAMQHVASDACIAWVTQTCFGRSLARNVRALADEMTSTLADLPASRARWDDASLGDLSRFPGYAVMALGRRRASTRPANMMLWSGREPVSAAPAGSGLLPHTDEDVDHADLRRRAVRLLDDLREGLRIEARYRPLAVDLDAQLFGPLDAAVRGRRARLDRFARRAWEVADAPAVEPCRPAARGVGPGPISR